MPTTTPTSPTSTSPPEAHSMAAAHLAYDRKQAKKTRSNLQALSAALRQPLPPTFRWDFTVTIDEHKHPFKCGYLGCALGLAAVLWFPHPWLALENLDTFHKTTFPTMSVYHFTRVFVNSAPNPDPASVTPHDIADRIDQYLNDPANQPT